MVKICLTDFGRKYISRIVGNLEIPEYSPIVGIHPAIISLAENGYSVNAP